MVRDMNKLELIISGNLTGFSRFFVTSGANDLLKDAKIDFDYRNFVSFMEEGDKTYAVSFAPQVIALSLVSRTLDSFRRPGILVVSLLLPRNTKVESINSPQNERAVYQLLNAINDKFNEKNLHNGMLNQNPIVLMQDYYTEILQNYRFLQDYQRGVNLTIDNSTFNKNVGYVNSSEKDIVAYLNTPCRRAYEGYHSIFISPKAPQNIDEPVEELKLYNVYVNNTNQRLSNVTIDSVIQTVFPKRGEIDNNFPKEVRNLTYRQVLDGQGGKYIGANIAGDTINLVYHFEKETKQVTFQIIGENGEIDFSHVTLVVQNDDGIYYTISNNPYIFVGEEIYKAKTLKSGDDNYDFSQSLDLSSILDEGTVLVKIKPEISQPSANHVINTMPTSMAGREFVPVVSAHSAEKKKTYVKKGGIFSNSIPNSDKDKVKSNHDIRKVVIPLVAFWLVLGGIYAVWTHFGMNSDLKTLNVETSDSVDETISFYIADTSVRHGEVVSDRLKEEGYDKLGDNNIVFEVSASINGKSVDFKLQKNDTIHYAGKVEGVLADSLIVNLIVKWTREDKQESILEIPKTYSLYELKEGEGKKAIQLPVAFSDLMFYNDLKNSTYKEQRTSDRIDRIKDKSEKLYNKMMDEYQKKKPKPVVGDEIEISKKKESKKGTEDEALNDINKNQFKEVDCYEWKNQKNKERATKWANFTPKKKKEYAGHITKWESLDTIN